MNGFHPTSYLQILFLGYATQLRTEKIEKLLLLFLDEKLEVIAQKEVTQESQQQAEFCVEAVFAPALIHGAKNLVIIHNHPSGSPLPSAADYLTTIVIAQAGMTVQVSLIDHIIVTHSDYFSFRKAGIL
jgi:DNA repair protein RadC